MFTANRRAYLPFVAAAALCLTLVGNAEAQQPAPPDGDPSASFPAGAFTVTPFVGFGFSGDLDNATGLFGAAAGYAWNSRTIIEAEFSMMPSSEASGVVEVDSSVVNFTANLRYHFGAQESWRPYGAVGLGVGHASVDVDGEGIEDVFDDSSTAFIFNFGGGAERRISDRLVFRGDLRYFFGSNLVPDYWRLSAGIGFQVFR